jgi:phosphatidate cytidylyltransferase
MKRIVTGLILGIAWILLLLYSPFFLFGLVVCVIGAVGLYEYFRMVFRDEEKRFVKWGVICGLVPLAAAVGGHIEWVALAVFVGLILAVAITLQTFSSLPNGFDFMAKLLFGVAYIGFCLSHLTLIRRLPDGVNWLIVLTAVIIASDSGAYYWGSWFGKRKLIPGISPGKTWAGALGGLIGGMMVAVVSAVWLLQTVDLVRLLFVGFLLVIFGMAGDLLESVIKRSAGVKDSGSWLAGHGGMLDRGDSLLLAAPALYYLIRFGLLPA